MQKLIQNPIVIILGASLTTVFLNLAVVLDTNFIYRWYIFFAWITLLSWLIYWCNNYKLKLTTPRKSYDIILIIVFILAFISRFLYINIYPFPTIGDQMRDGGWNARQLLQGEVKNIFYYGRYESHGLLIPTFIIPFYVIFGNSALSFKIPAAILGILDIVLLYILVKKLFNKAIATLTVLILITLPLHLYYSRTEVVVIFSSTLTTITILAITKLWEAQNQFMKDYNGSLKLFVINNYTKQRDQLTTLFRNFILLGLICGFNLNFHGSLRPVTLLTTLVIIIYSIKLPLKHIHRLSLYCSYILALIIGFGPRLVVSPPEILFQTQSINLIAHYKGTTESKASLQDIQKWVKVVSNKTFESLLVIFYNPTTSHYLNHQPILPKGAIVIIILGFAYTIQQKHLPHITIATFLLTIPFTNSAITDVTNADHRLAPLFPIVSVITGVGLWILYKCFKKLSANNLFINLLTLSVITIITYWLTIPRFIEFFQKEYASIGPTPQLYRDYMATYLYKILQAQNIQGDLYLTTNMSMNDYFNLMHIREQFYYFTPNVNLIYNVNTTLPDTVIFISNKNTPLDQSIWKINTFCAKPVKYICPIDNTSFTIYTYYE